MKVKMCILLVIVASMIVAGSGFTMAQEAKQPQKTQEKPQQEGETEVKTIDPNVATLEELKTLPGIGPKLAQAIIDGRPYKAADDLLAVKGIGEKKLEKMKPLLKIAPVKEEKQEEKIPAKTPAKD